MCANLPRVATPAYRLIPDTQDAPIARASVAVKLTPTSRIERRTRQFSLIEMISESGYGFLGAAFALGAAAGLAACALTEAAVIRYWIVTCGPVP